MTQGRQDLLPLKVHVINAKWFSVFGSSLVITRAGHPRSAASIDSFSVANRSISFSSVIKIQSRHVDPIKLQVQWRTIQESAAAKATALVCIEDSEQPQTLPTEATTILEPEDDNAPVTDLEASPMLVAGSKRQTRMENGDAKVKK